MGRFIVQARGPAKFQTNRLSNGVPVALFGNENLNSISVGVFTRVSVPQEDAGENGIAHFLEHMTFKGTARRTAKGIAKAMDKMGGYMNAHTAKEYTCYHMNFLPEMLSPGIDLLADIFINSTLLDADIDMERQVVLEEIHMVEDSPEDYIHDYFPQLLWGNVGIGRPILGIETTLSTIGRVALSRFKSNYFVPENTTISIAGRFTNPQKIMNVLDKHFQWKAVQSPGYATYDRRMIGESSVKLITKDCEQIHFCLGGDGMQYTAANRHAFALLLTVLGGSMSSRLFQEVREKRGLAYSIYAYGAFYRICGYWSIYAGVNARQFPAALRVIFQQLDRLTQNPIPQAELKKAKAHAIGGIVLGLEKSSAWMNWMGKSWLYLDRLIDPSEVVDAISAVTTAEIQALAQLHFNPSRMALAAIGPIDKLSLGSTMSMADLISKISRSRAIQV